MSLTALPLVSKLSNSVIRILGCNPGLMTLQGTNTYLVGTGASRVLIDCGDEETAPKYIKVLENILNQENATIDHLVVTHWHHDHLGGAKAIKNLISKRSRQASPIIWKFPRAQTNAEMIDHFIDNWLSDEQIIEVEGAKLKIIYTPGHTPDHVCILMDNGNVLFSGDCILGETTAVFEDLKDYLHSLNKILKLKPCCIYPGHGPVVDDPLPRINMYIQHRMTRENQILELLNKNPAKALLLSEIVSILYKDVPENLWPAAGVNVTHHLEKLLKESKVENDDQRWLLTAKMN